MKEITEDKGRVRPVVEGDFQCDENGNSTRFYEILSIIGYVKDDGTKIGYISKTDVPIGTPITDTDYWYPFQVVAVPKGDKGDTGADGKSAYELYIEHGGTIAPVEAWIASLQGKDGKDGKDGVTPIIKVSDNGMDILISSDNGETWYVLIPDFTKLRVLGFVNSISQLPKSADIGDIYGVWNAEAQGGTGAYELYINTVTDWNLDATITKVYSYDVELPSVAQDGSVAIVPVKLVLDKEKVDAYKVYKYSSSSRGWILILNTAEIYNTKEDIVNHGDNLYALVQGNGLVTETKLKEETIASKKDYCHITNMTDESLLLIITQDSKRMFHSIGTGTYMIPNECGVFLVNDHDLTGIVVAESISDPNPKELSELEYMPEGIYPYYILTESSAGDIYVTPESKLDPEGEPVEGLTVETKITTLLSFSQTYELYKRVVNWVFFGTNASITYHLIQDVEEGTSTNILSGEAIKLKFAEFAAALDAFKQEIKDTYGDYEENSEFVRVTLDHNNKILYGVQANGNFYFGAGCPQQVKDYIEKRIADFSPTEYESIVSFLDNLELEDKTLRELLNEKVDKEEGKSLIDKDFADGVGYIENPEFVNVKLDSNGHILEATNKDGKKFLGAGVKIVGDVNLDSADITTISNPEFIAIWTVDNKILFAITTTADFYFGAGVPTQIIKYVDKKISEILGDEDVTIIIDTLREITSFLDGFVSGSNLLEYLNSTYGYYEENPEYVKVYLDSTGKIIKATTIDGVEIFGVGYSIDNIVTTVIDNPEFFRVYIDDTNRIVFGLKKDGDVMFGCGVPKQVQDYITPIKNVIPFYIDNQEYIESTIDSKGKLLAGRTSNGEAFENIGFSTPKISIDGNTIDNIKDKEKRSEIIIDSNEKVISYRDSNGIKHENVGFETNILKANSFKLPTDTQEEVGRIIDVHISPKDWYLPKFGKVNIKSETFYLTADQRWSNKNDVVCIQILDDTDANAANRKTLSYYYIKSTLTPLAGGGYDRTSVNENSVQLQLFPGKDVVESNGQYFVKKITKVNGEYYLTSSLAESNGVYDINYLYGQANSMKVNYTDENPDQTTLTNAIEVGKITDIPPYKAWFVGKQLEHYCIADIDFGTFYNKTNVPVGIKYQGSASTAVRKRGFRLTFYKKNDYKKKDKVKIGEMVRLSGFNMKSYYGNPIFMDPILSNVFIEMWETRGKDAYPWNKDNSSYSGATGFIKSFPIETWFGDEFFGLQIFGLKKDERNYLLDGDDDSSGIFASGANTSNDKDFSNASNTDFEDEMMDKMSQETSDAIDELCKYTKGFTDGTIEIEGQQVDFNNKMLEERIDIDDWIDYWIGLETFMLWDNTFHNVILYSGRDKKKFSLFFYDLDNGMDHQYDWSLVDIMHQIGWNVVFWEKFTDEYKDYILNRYNKLRKSILNISNIKAIYDWFISDIPERVLQDDSVKWDYSQSFNVYLNNIEKRLHYLDNNNFNL